MSVDLPSSTEPAVAKRSRLVRRASSGARPFVAGAAGAVAAPVIGIVAPNQFGTLPSILMVCWVAVGGRGTLYGAVIGAILVNWGATRVSEQWPDTWQYVQGLTFVVVVALVPGGIVGVARLLRERFARRRPVAAAAERPAGDAGAAEGLVTT